MLLTDEFFRQKWNLRQFGGLSEAVPLGAGASVTEQLARALGRVVESDALAFHHVCVKFGRTANGLAGVVDDEIETRA